MGLRSYLKSRTEALNPYYSAAAMTLSRFLWDMHSESWRSRKKLKSLRNQYTGKKAVILCNGPSLLKSDLSLLTGIFTFGLNKINLLFDKTEFRPSCVVAVNPFVLEQNKAFFNKTQIPLFLDSKGLEIGIESRESVSFLHSTLLERFARDCSMSIYQGSTVTYVAMQLAYHMGFQKVALIGADHTFVTKGTPNKTVISGETDKNHFHKDYFAGGVKWQLPDIPGSERSYLLARETFVGDCREIVNATEGGELELFKRMSLKQFVNGT